MLVWPKVFLFSFCWILTGERRVKVPSTKISNITSECTQYMSSPIVKLNYRRRWSSGKPVFSVS
ncbi:BgTH12-01766 [Blumeria graminis f. sp. triticale]|uniref:Bgt-55111 n=2 Tax=Blumeria graminis TaxID=34373 RepID=A0A9X9MG67_BLUGR|nr:BgTH12-01766 [Blumeria graminis f. sp. triticale]VDB84069.1 Bgt-55111 [Blumeria graminis f. sp. tritici]